MAKRKEKLRVALIGCGGISGRHAQALLADKRVEITRLADISPKNLKRFKERFPDLANVPEHKDYREVLDDVDAVSIATPHTLHYEQAMAALDHGLHVLCEKPLACTVARAKKIAEKAKQKHRKLQVGYQRKAESQFRYIHDQIRSGALGKLYFVSVVLSQQWLYLHKGSWRQNPALSGGGQLNDSGSHVMDMLLWLLNQKPVQVSAFSDNRGTKVDIDSAVNIQFDKGALGSVAIIATAHNWGEVWHIVGSKGTLLVDGDLKKISEVNGKAEDVVLPKQESTHITTNWVDAIFGKAKLLSPAEAGVEVIRLTEAIWKSAAAGGKPVRIRSAS